MSTSENNLFGSYETLVRSRRSDPSWLSVARESAMQRFSKLGWPTTRDEDWKYTSVAPISERQYELHAPVAPPDRQAIDQLAPITGGLRLVFLNGTFAPALSDLDAVPSGVTVQSLSAASRSLSAAMLEPHFAQSVSSEGRALTVLNTAFLEDGALIQVPPRTVMNAPIHLVFVSTSTTARTMAHPRNLVLIGAESQATVVESYVAGASGASFTNAVSEVFLGEGAALEHYSLQNEAESAAHVSLLRAEQARSSRLTSHVFALGGSLGRSEVRTVLSDEGAEVNLNGLYVGTGSQLLDQLTHIDHAKPNCVSRELYKGVLDGRARGVFNGRVVVRENAIKTDASQTNRNLLLSEDAQIDTRPQLEIFADDVKCTHGTAVGQLDEEALFYLRARGIPGGAARSLLTYAFAREMVAKISLEPVRAWVESQLGTRLGAAPGEAW